MSVICSRRIPSSADRACRCLHMDRNVTIGVGGIVIDGVVSHGSRFRKYQMYTQYRTDDVTKAKIAAIRCRCRCVES